ncbi:MAG: YfiR family protein [Oligoflexia bacterium]|nr:YfiR family protein [Oligoflexia bacterium]
MPSSCIGFEQHWLGKIRLGGIVLLTLAASPALGQTQFSLDEVKAAYLLNFGKFVDWPPGALPPSTESALQVCVLGRQALHPELETVLAGQKVHERRLEVRRLTPGNAWTGCHLVYFGEGALKEAARILSLLKDHGVLTVGDGPGFVEEGCVIELRHEAEHVRFRISLAAAERARLRVSSKLLGLAEVVP